jgi:hypothetical protein
VRIIPERFAELISGGLTDNRLLRAHGTRRIQDSAVTLTDAGALSGLTDITMTGKVIGNTRIQRARATATQTVNNSIVLTDDTALSVSLAANTVYDLIGCAFHYSPTSNPDYRCAFRWTAAGAVVWIACQSTYATSNLRATVRTASGSHFGQMNIVGGNYSQNRIIGTIATVGNSGTLYYQWAQWAAVAENSLRGVGSFLRLEEHV